MRSGHRSRVESRSASRRSYRSPWRRHDFIERGAGSAMRRRARTSLRAFHRAIRRGWLRRTSSSRRGRLRRSPRQPTGASRPAMRGRRRNSYQAAWALRGGGRSCGGGSRSFSSSAPGDAPFWTVVPASAYKFQTVGLRGATGLCRKITDFSWARKRPPYRSLSPASQLEPSVTAWSPASAGAQLSANRYQHSYRLSANADEA